MFARIYLILHGGSATAIDAKLKALGEPPIAHDLASNPFPRLRVVWEPARRRQPAHRRETRRRSTTRARSTSTIDAGDIFDEQLVDTAPWSAPEAIYQASRAHGRPFAIPEWGLFGIDDDKFVQHMCDSSATSGRSRPRSEAEEQAGLPRLHHAARRTRPGLGVREPDDHGQSVELAGADVHRRRSDARLRHRADRHRRDRARHRSATGVIAKAYWIRSGHAVGPITVPAGATGASFQTGGGGSPPTPVVRPQGGTDFHVEWNGSGITSAWWTRVGKALSTIPVTAGQTSIAMAQGP